jgi:hypothetical protein
MPRKAKSPSPKRAAKRARDAVIEKYGSLPIGKAGSERKKDIDWLEKNFVTLARLFGPDTIQRKLCNLKGIYFDSYEDPND